MRSQNKIFFEVQKQAFANVVENMNFCMFFHFYSKFCSFPSIVYIAFLKGRKWYPRIDEEYVDNNNNRRRSSTYVMTSYTSANQDQFYKWITTHLHSPRNTKPLALPTTVYSASGEIQQYPWNRKHFWFSNYFKYVIIYVEENVSV